MAIHPGRGNRPHPHLRSPEVPEGAAHEGAWIVSLPARTALEVRLERKDAAHTQYVRVGVQGLPASDLEQYDKNHRFGPFDTARNVSVQPRSKSNKGTDAESRFKVRETTANRHWLFYCDDGPGGDGDYNDLIFSVSLYPPSS